ncbi:MAG: hypothetical protein ISR51_05535 [Rhodospirillales bacterium]|nr:hypothetical protein [Alphaproteobacteria bacterium]MBL6948120.1 hypothetical protein [Rhodospirillales bacterium]
MTVPLSGRLFLGMLAAAVLVPGASGADSINTVYDMDRMLFEPHPMASEYGTRWTGPPSAAGVPNRSQVPQAPSPQTTRPQAPNQAETLLAPLPAGSTSLPPSEPPSMPVPAMPQPAPQPVAVEKPANAEATVFVLPPTGAAAEFKLEPRLSLDTGGLDLDVIKTAPPRPPPPMPDPIK